MANLAIGFIAGMAFLKWGWPPVWEWAQTWLPKF